MPNPLIAMMGVSALTGVMGASAQANAASDASQAQQAAAQRGIDATTALMNPYIDAGTSALAQMLNLNGTNGADAQQTAIDAIQNSSQFTSLRNQGYDALNQNAAATGGLRGGNQEAALGQFAPNMLNTLIQQQLANYAGIASGGQQAAEFTSGAYTQGYNQQGSAQAGGDIARGNAYGSMWGSIGGAANYGLGQAMQPQQMMNPVTGGMQTNPAALPGGLFGSWGF